MLQERLLQKTMPQNIDKKAVADSFSKAAGHYDQFAQLQRDIGKQLLRQLSVENPSQVVDLGCGTGYFSEKLAKHFPTASITCFDLSNEMLNQTKKRNINNANYQLGDIDNLPFAESSVDLIYSNLVVQWSNSFSECIAQIEKCLQQGGKCHLSTLLDGTLNELTSAWENVDKNPHTNRFLTLETMQVILQQTNFSSVKINTKTIVLHYKSVIEVMRALKGIGANHVHVAHQTNRHQTTPLSGKKLLNALEAGYQPYKNESGLLNLTYEVCYIEVTK